MLPTLLHSLRAEPARAIRRQPAGVPRVLLAMKAVAIAGVLALRARDTAACSCGAWTPVTAETCGTARRVFAGEVAGYRWFGLGEMLLKRPRVAAELAVDRVWRGSVPARVTAYTGHGGGDCGIGPPIGMRFVVCDDRTGDAAPDFELCSRPAFAAPELEAALGPAAAPSAPSELPARLAIIALVLGCATAWSRSNARR